MTQLFIILGAQPKLSRGHIKHQNMIIESYDRNVHEIFNEVCCFRPDIA